jgi:hypothetical protein
MMLRNILDRIKDFSFVHMLFFMQAAQASTALPARYQRLGFEFATASKKLTFATGFWSRRFGNLPHLWLDRI